MKRFLKSFCSFGLVLLLILSLSIISFADVNDLMIGTGSNALMTLELDDSDYSVMPMSSIGTVTNTVAANSLPITLKFSDGSGNYTLKSVVAYKNNGRYTFNTSAPSGAYLDFMQIELFPSDLPTPGSYSISFDYSSAFSYEYSDIQLYSDKHYKNVKSDVSWLDVPFNSYSGDVYVAPYNINITNLSYCALILYTPKSEYVSNVGGSFAISFVNVSDGDYPSTAGTNTSSEDYQSGVSSSLSDLSSSVDTMTDEISGVTEAIQNLQGAMEPHYSNVLTQLHHITEQLHAFYDQVYNNIHLVELDILEGILAAIENMDLEVNVELGGLKQTIERVSSEIQANDNKLAAEQIANDEANTEEIKDAVEEHGNFIIDGLKGLFIPSDEFFKSYFDDLYEYFADRFGFLSFPIELVIRIADMFLTSEKVDAVLILPSFEISGYQVWEQYIFNFTEFLETSFPFLIVAIQTVTSIGLVMAFVNLCQDKWNEVMKS